MDLFQIFKTDHDGIRKSHVKNLVTVAMADGRLDDDEWDLLVAIAQLVGIREQEIQTIKEAPELVQFVPPKKYDEKVQQLQDLVAVMTIDGEINERELQLCQKIAVKLDLLPQIVDDIISEVITTRPR